MKRNGDELLGRVSVAVSDGEPVDWQECERLARSEREKECLDNLRLVSEVARLARSVPELSEPTLPHANVGARAANPGTEALPFETWGSLKLLESIGGGGFASVYRAWDQRLHRQVALKLLRPELSLDPEWEARFLVEARLLARVEHVHVVRIYGIETHAGRTGIWMELVHGTSLAMLVAERGAASVAEAVRIGIDLCGALAAIHAAKIIHQDIKPHNVIDDGQGRAVLMDFGAGRSRSTGPNVEDPHGIVGTPRYMAPELFQGAAPSPQSDLYSLGLLLAFLVLGRHAVPRVDPPSKASPEPVRLAALRPDLPASFTSCVDRALAPDRSQRYGSAEEMRDALEKVAVAVQEAVVSPAPARNAALSQRRRRLVPVLVAAALLLLLGTVEVARRSFAPTLSGQAELTATRAGASRSLAAGAAISSQDRLELHLNLSRAAHVYVLNVDTTGQAVLLFPMAGGGTQNPLPAHQALVLPGVQRGERLGWSLSAEPGVERFLVVASVTRLEEFEAATARIPAVALGGGLTATPIEDDAITALVRGVTGVAKITDAPATQTRPDLFALAQRLARERRGNGIWLHELRLEKQGP